jgi:hypothetical protein
VRKGEIHRPEANEVVTIIKNTGEVNEREEAILFAFSQLTKACFLPSWWSYSSSSNIKDKSIITN